MRERKDENRVNHMGKEEKRSKEKRRKEVKKEGKGKKKGKVHKRNILMELLMVDTSRESSGKVEELKDRRFREREGKCKGFSDKS